jgi:hypothetical protein
MRTLFSILLIVSSISLTQAQIETPQPSPNAMVEQVIGLTTVSVEYSRPSMRGRTIFGDLVPYGKVWRTGANENTIIEFSDNVTILGNDIEKGSYAIYTKPMKSQWEVYFYIKTDNWGTPQKWNEDKIAAQVTVDVQKIERTQETFRISFDNLSANKGHLEMVWANTMVEIPIEVPTDQAVMASIDQAMKGTTATEYYSAAGYYYSQDKDIKQAKEWIDKAMDKMDDAPFWMLRQQSLIYAKAGDKKGAVKVAKQSLKKAKAAGNDAYVKMNKESLKEWGAM